MTHATISHHHHATTLPRTLLACLTCSGELHALDTQLTVRHAHEVGAPHLRQRIASITVTSEGIMISRGRRREGYQRCHRGT